MSKSVSRGSAIRPVCRCPTASRYSTSRFSGNSVRNDPAAVTASPKRCTSTRPRILCTSSSTLAAATTGCKVTVMASSKKLGRTSLPALRLYRNRYECRRSELEADLHAKDPRTQRHFGLDILARGRERARILVREVLAVNQHVPRSLLGAERRIERVVARHRVA